MYNNMRQSNFMYPRDGRFGGFAVPFLLGGLVGGAAVGVSRPRPIIAVPNPVMPPYGGYPFYNGYYPRPF